MSSLAKYIILVLLVGIASTAAGQGFWKNTKTDEVPVLSLHKQAGLSKEPILLVFANGEMVWDADYFGDNQAGNQGITDEEKELRRLELRSILKQVDKTDPDWVQNYLMLYRENPVLSRPLNRQEQLLGGSVDRAVVEYLLEKLYGERAFTINPAEPSAYHRPSLVFTLFDGFTEEHIRGSYRKAYDPTKLFDEIEIRSDRENTELAWHNLLSVLTSLRSFHLKEPAAVDRGNFAWIDFVPPWVYYSSFQSNTVSTSTIKSAESTLLEVESLQLLQSASALWDSGNADAAILMLQSKSDALSDQDKPLVLERLAMYLIATGNYDEAFTTMESTRLYSGRESMPANMLIRLGYLCIRKREKAQALSHFSRILFDGTVTPSRTVWQEALIRTAALLEIYGTHDQAVNAYDLVFETAENEEARNHALLQKVALNFERAKGDSGSIAPGEVQGLLTRVRQDAEMLANFISEPSKTKATAELIALETYYYQKKYQDCIAASKTFMEEWSPADQNVSWNLSRLLVTAQTYELICAYEAGLFDRVIDLARHIRERYRQGDPYPAFNSFAYSHLYEGLALRQIGQNADAANCFTRCETEYTEWYRTIGRREIELADQ